jgi:hypothetical protein
MKEISKELHSRRCSICCMCGAIFEGTDTIFAPCPNCCDTWGLHWITEQHGWINYISLRETRLCLIKERQENG